MSLGDPAKWKKYHTGLFTWQTPKKTKKLRVSLFALLCPSLHVAPRRLPGAASGTSRIEESPERTVTMTTRRLARFAAAVAAFTAIVLAGIGSSSPRAKSTDDDNHGNESRIQRGLEIAPLHLNLAGTNPALVRP